MTIDRLRTKIALMNARSAPPPSGQSADPQVDNLRKSLRKASRVPGLIYPGGSMASIPCTISDQSAGGARLSMQTGWVNPFRGESSLKERFTLVMRMDRVEVDCEIIRIDENEMGVKFLSMMRPLSRKI